MGKGDKKRRGCKDIEGRKTLNGNKGEETAGRCSMRGGAKSDGRDGVRCPPLYRGSEPGVKNCGECVNFRKPDLLSEKKKHELE